MQYPKEVKINCELAPGESETYREVREKADILCARVAEILLNARPRKVEITLSRLPIKGGIRCRRTGMVIVTVVGKRNCERLESVLMRPSRNKAFLFIALANYLSRIGLEWGQGGTFYFGLKERS